MTDFMMLFRGGDQQMAKLSPEAMQQHLGQWRQWLDDLKAKGNLKAGDPLAGEGRVVSQHGQVSDGPYAEAKDLVGGYVIVTAESIDHATEMAKSCPVCELGGTTEIRPINVL